MKKFMGCIAACSGILLALFFVLVALDVFARNVLKVSLPWVSEASTFAFIWMTLISSVAAFIEDKHYKVSIFSEAFEKRAEPLLFAVEWLSVVVFAGLLVWQGVNFTRVSAMRFSTALGFRMDAMVCIIPICGACIILAMLHRLFLYRKTKHEGEKRP